ncbi:MAG: SGNH/GDSL hydrolase family protein, partial [Verrucomicrobiaceae bacterium]
GKDIILPESGSRELSLPQGSPVPHLKLEELFPAAGSPDAIRAAKGERAAKFGPDRFLRWAENPRAFHAKQLVVTYRHKDKWTGFRPAFAGAELKWTLEKLRKREPLKIAVIGDSISAGGSASVTVRQPPMMPPYDRLVLDRLRKKYGGEIQLVNLAKGGQVTEWALTQVPLIIDQKPDLLIVAFGMNDGSARIKPERFGEAHAKLLEGVRAGLPEADFILVSPIHGNPEWTASAPDLYPKYLATLQGFRGPGVAVADVTTPFGEMLALKSYADLTLNGVNHPNDFGHRLYADVIFALLAE